MNQSSRIILVDCDGVLVNWNDGFHTWITAQGYTQKNNHDYGIAQRYGIDESLAYSLVGAFNHSDRIAELDPLPHAVSVVRELHFRHRFDFVVISSLSDDPIAGVRRRDNLYKHFGVEPWLHIKCIGCGEPKDSELERFEGSNCFWIEDNAENAALGLKYGLRPLILDAPYNQHANEEIPRLHNWVQLWNHIILQ
jgi:beta-phosphoglucomutase-like phosphatase (HAD superfamily)